MKTLIAFVSALIFVLAGPTMAESICGRAASADFVIGEYKMEMGPREIKTSRSTRIFPNVFETPATIFAVNDALFLVTTIGAIDISLTPVSADEPVWQFSAREGFSPVSSEDMGLAADCDFADFPRLVGSGTMTDVNGIVLDVTMKLVILLASDSIELAIGTLEYSIDTISDGRPFHMETKVKVLLNPI